VLLSSGGSATCGVTTEGASYCWGNNDFGQLGDGTFSPRSSPVPVQGGLSFVVLSAGESHTCGVMASGAAYCWGKNTSGELGAGFYQQDGGIPRPVPVVQ
jgi:alpha-tubulin suppressor-like RCC1 family protein